MSAVDRNDLVAFVAGSLYGESPLSIEDAVAGALRLADEFDDHGWTVHADRDPVDDDEIRIEFDPAVIPKWMTIGGQRYDCVPAGSVVLSPGATHPVEDVSVLLATELADRFDERESSPDVEEPEVPTGPGHGQETWTSEGGHDFRLGFGPQSGDEYRLDLVRKTGEDPADIVCSNLPRSVAAALYESLGRHLAATDEPDEEIETINDTMVSATMSDPPRISWLGAAPGVSVEMALRHAAWVVALADPLDERFPKILRAVRST